MLAGVKPPRLYSDPSGCGLDPGRAPAVPGNCLRSAFTQAEKWLLVPCNVVKLTDSPHRKRVNLQVLAPEDAKIFVQACQEHRLGSLLCAMHTLGLRMREALGLKWEDIDLDRATVFVRRGFSAS